MRSWLSWKRHTEKTRKFLLMWHCSARRLANRGRKQQKSLGRHKKSYKFAFNQIRLLCFGKKSGKQRRKKIFISNSNAWKITFFLSPFGRDNFYYWKHQNTRTNKFGSSSLVKVSRTVAKLRYFRWRRDAKTLQNSFELTHRRASCFDGKRRRLERSQLNWSVRNFIFEFQVQCSAETIDIAVIALTEDDSEQTLANLSQWFANLADCGILTATTSIICAVTSSGMEILQTGI